MPGKSIFTAALIAATIAGGIIITILSTAARAFVTFTTASLAMLAWLIGAALFVATGVARRIAAAISRIIRMAAARGPGGCA